MSIIPIVAAFNWKQPIVPSTNATKDELEIKNSNPGDLEMSTVIRNSAIKDDVN